MMRVCPGETGKTSLKAIDKALSSTMRAGASEQ